MAVYRNIQTTFWTDPKIIDDFTPEDKYFYLYLFTNPHTNLCGCYEISKRQVVLETGYSKETIEKLLTRFEEIHKVICFSKETKEVLLVNWSNYNWTSSEKFRKPLYKEIEHVKNTDFKSFLMDRFNNEDTVSIPYQYGMDTTVTDTVTDTVSVSIKDKYKNNITNSINEHNYSSYISNILTEWFMYKKEKGQSYKAIGITKLLNKVDKVLLEYSEQELAGVIEECMERNYQGIIWDLLDKKKNNGSGSAYMDAIKNRVNVVDDWV